MPFTAAKYIRAAGVKAAARISAALTLLLIFFGQSVFFIRANSATYDEAMHVAAGYSYLATRDFRIEPQNPPLIKQLLALPLFLSHRIPFTPQPEYWRNADGYSIGQDFVYKSPVPADRILLLTRLPNVLLGGALVALTGWWAYRLWGSGAAILAMAMASFEPNIVAHSSLMTTDTGATLFIFLAIYLLWEYLRLPRWWLLSVTGMATGMALLGKFSAVILIPIIAAIMAASLYTLNQPVLPANIDSVRRKHNLLKGAAAFAVMLVVAASVMLPGYQLRGFQPWFYGLSQFIALARQGQPAFFLGGYSYEGWWSYFAVAFLVKTPIGTLLLIASSLICPCTGSRLGRREVIFLLLPAALIILAMTQARVNIGLRHILPVYPFLFVLASRLATVRCDRRWLTPILVAIPLSWTAVSGLRIAPHHLAYFNEFVGGPDQGYRYLSDSNVDWGQDLKGLKAYMERQKLPIIYLSYFGTAPPSYYGIRYQYVPGTWPLEWPPPPDRVPPNAPQKILAISVCNLQDVGTPHDPLFRWLWLRQPVMKIGYSIFVYDLTGDREGLAKLEETYVKAGITLGP